MKRTLWVLLDDRRGSVGQAKGIIMALGDRINVVEKQLVYNSFGGFPNWIKGRSLMGVDLSKTDSLSGPYPDIVLSTSRRTVSTARWIRKMSEQKTKIVQLMYPDGGVGIKDMEKIIVPSHDNIKKQNNPKAFVITGAPHQMFPEKLANARKEWEPRFAELPKPWTAVIVGGAIKGKPWPLENAKELAMQLKRIHDTIGGSLFFTTSRRTGKEAEKIILDELKGIPMYTYIWGEQKENPLIGFYACADLTVVTADSVSMCSEACAADAPVLLFKGKNWLSSKHLRFAQSLIEQKYAEDITSPQALSFKSSSKLNSANEVADEILKIS